MQTAELVQECIMHYDLTCQIINKYTNYKLVTGFKIFNKHWYHRGATVAGDPKQLSLASLSPSQLLDFVRKFAMNIKPNSDYFHIKYVTDLLEKQTKEAKSSPSQNDFFSPKKPNGVTSLNEKMAAGFFGGNEQSTGYQQDYKLYKNKYGCDDCARSGYIGGDFSC